MWAGSCLKDGIAGLFAGEAWIFGRLPASSISLARRTDPFLSGPLFGPGPDPWFRGALDFIDSQTKYIVGLSQLFAGGI